MKISILYLAACLFFLACNNAPHVDQVETTDKKAVLVEAGHKYVFDSTSLITWTASKPGKQHTGTFKLKEGAFIVNENTLTGGHFVIDIGSITNLDLAADQENKAKLEGHLKSPDFFNIAKYPTALFEITAVVPYVKDSSKIAILNNPTHTISGNFTLKDSTKNISFPARITIDAATLSATANFNIDRTVWGLNYKGPGNPQDWYIGKDVNLKLALTGTKK